MSFGSRRRPAEKPQRRKSVILVWMDGGPTHLDMYDMKPDAPVEIRGELKPVRTKVPGMDICELLPRHAQLADRLALVRGIKSWIAHSPFETYTGFPRVGEGQRPAFGSIVSRMTGGWKHGFPCYVTLNYISNPEAESALYAGAEHKPLRFTDYRGMANLSLPYGMTINRLEDREGLLTSFDTLRREMDRRDPASADKYTQQALDIVTSGKVAEAFDLRREPDKVRSRYPKGKTWGGDWDGERLLLARRLVEAGAGVVTLTLSNWDHHGVPPAQAMYPSLRNMLPLLDQSLYALLTDLHERGLSDDVIVVMVGEFGRSPQLNKYGGREHWGDAGAALISGGGLRLGQVVGETDSRGERARGKPFGFQNIFATLYHALGIDPAATIPDLKGRPQYLLDDREPITELI